MWGEEAGPKYQEQVIRCVRVSQGSYHKGAPTRAPSRHLFSESQCGQGPHPPDPGGKVHPQAFLLSRLSSALLDCG